VGRPRLPTKVLELRGTFKKNPKRRLAREGEPVAPGKLGAPPDCLDKDEQARWYELSEAAPWLAAADRFIVELACGLWMLERRGKATATESRLLVSILGRLGMTPADRSKVKVPQAPPKKVNAFTRLQGRGKP